MFSHFPGGSDGKESAYNAGDPGSIPGSGRSPKGTGYPLQTGGLQSMQWQSQICLSNKHFSLFLPNILGKGAY